MTEDGRALRLLVSLPHGDHGIVIFDHGDGVFDVEVGEGDVRTYRLILPDTVDRLQRALRVAAHNPHDQDRTDPDSGYPVCSVCGAIQTDLEFDADGDPIRPDSRSKDWYNGYAEAQREKDPRVAALEPYTSHKDECFAGLKFRGCICGLSALLPEWSPLSTPLASAKIAGE